MLQVIDIEGNSLLVDTNVSFSIFEVKNTCDNVAAACKKTWTEDVPNLIEKIGKRLDEEEKARIKKQKEEEAARQKKQEAEERKAQAEEEAKQKRKKRIIKHSIICIVLFFIGFISNKEMGVSNHLLSCVGMIFSCYFWYYFIRWIWRGIKNRKK